MELRFEFEQLQLAEFGEGVLFYGEATLVDNQGETDTFIVKDIKLGDKWLPHVPRGGPRTIGTCLFEAIAAVLYDDKSAMGKMAALEWADAVSGETPAVPMFKRRYGLGTAARRGSNAVRIEAPSGYVHRSIWAEDMERQGFGQFQCGECHRWTIWKRETLIYELCDCRAARQSAADQSAA